MRSGNHSGITGFGPAATGHGTKRAATTKEHNADA